MFRIHTLYFITLVYLLFIPSAMTQAQSPLLEEITIIYNNTANRSSKIDVTQQLLKYIPIGSTVGDAKTVLAINGFRVTISFSHGIDYLNGSKEIGRTFLGFDEADLTMTIVDGKVSTSTGSIFRHLL